MLLIYLVIGVVLALLILRRPYLGIAFTAASIPVIDLLPSIPGFTSAIPLIGAITLFGFIWQRKEEHRPLFRFGNVHILGLLFIVWIFISNPQAAWSGLDRNWLFTFLQLWVLLWMAGELLDTPQKLHTFMWVFGIVTVVSVLVAIIQQGNIGEDISSSSRAYGLAEGANTAARYFVIAMVFFNYLRTVVNKGFFRLVAMMGLMVAFLGVFFTVSRTGILLVFTVIGLLVLLNPSIKYRLQLLVVFAIAVLGLWFLSDNIVNIVKTITPSITRGSDTVGLRYAFWEAGWRMWLDHLFLGVGIGRFPAELRFYAGSTIPIYYINVQAHNMYVQVLAETGLIGFGIFVLLLIRSVQNLWRVDTAGSEKVTILRNVWLVVLLAIMLGGVTKTDYADKMIWLVMGVSIYFKNQIQVSKESSLSDKESRAFRDKSIPSYARKPAGRPLTR